MADFKITEPIMLDPQQTKKLQDMALSISLLKKEVEKAKRAGIDVKEIEERFNETIKLREGLLREYGSIYTPK